MLAALHSVKSLLSLLCQSALTLSECYENKVLNLDLLSRSFLDNLLDNLLRLLSQLVAQVVDLAVQIINLSLVTGLNNLEVVSTVAVLELVNDTSVELNEAVVDIVLNTSVRDVVVSTICLVVQAISDRRLDISLPLLLATEVEGEVDTQLRSQVVLIIECLATVETLVVVTEDVTPAKTCNRDNLEEAGLTLVTTEEVAQVQSS